MHLRKGLQFNCLNAVQLAELQGKSVLSGICHNTVLVNIGILQSLFMVLKKKKGIAKRKLKVLL